MRWLVIPLVLAAQLAVAEVSWRLGKAAGEREAVVAAQTRAEVTCEQYFDAVLDLLAIADEHTTRLSAVEEDLSATVLRMDGAHHELVRRPK